ncbi:MAG: histidine kinase [Butyrivibrio sp.]|jgi:uncharacterized membrane-anchored protein|nr:histidine kinase [Butyrivibrio sp.]
MYAAIEMQVISAVITAEMLFCSRYDKREYDMADRIMDTLLILNLFKVVCYTITLLLEGQAQLSVLNAILTCVKCGAGFPMVMIYTMYIKHCVTDKSRYPGILEYLCYVVCVTGIMLNLISISVPLVFSCNGGFYARGPLFVTNQGLGLFALLCDACLLIACRDRMKRHDLIALLSYMLIPLITVIAQIFLPPEPDLSDIGITLGLLIIFMFSHVSRGKLIAQQEKELTDMHISILISQIRPHFLYNTLAVIQGMCHGKAPEAEQTTIEFAEYLRGNMDFIGDNRMIAFTQELWHTQLYLSLEQKRFGGMLRTEYDTRDKDFHIPALTLQPIVENAVKHGIMKREEGGTVTIITEREALFHVITVRDDGVGFDPAEERKDDRSHIGIANVRERLKIMCSGTLEIRSVKGQGTEAVIRIPTGEDKHEDHMRR